MVVRTQVLQHDHIYRGPAFACAVFVLGLLVHSCTFLSTVVQSTASTMRLVSCDQHRLRNEDALHSFMTPQGRPNILSLSGEIVVRK